MARTSETGHQGPAPRCLARVARLDDGLEEPGLATRPRTRGCAPLGTTVFRDPDRITGDIGAMTMNKTSRVLPAALMLSIAGMAFGQTNAAALKKGFENPPNSARPLVWWHWMNGNITKEGIKLDLEWMHRVGHRRLPELRRRARDAKGGGEAPGVHDAGVEGRVQIRDHARPTNSAWKMAIAGSPGWSESGGPWVPASHGHEEVRVERDCGRGRQAVHGQAAPPPAVTGPFQNIALPPRGAGASHAVLRGCRRRLRSECPQREAGKTQGSRRSRPVAAEWMAPC